MRRVKAVQIYLVFSISFLVLALPVYPACAGFEETDLFPTDLIIENGDPEALIELQQAELKLYLSCVFSVVLPSGLALLSPFQSFSVQIPAFDQRTFILRC